MKHTKGKLKLITAKTLTQIPTRKLDHNRDIFACIGIKCNGTPVFLIPNRSGYGNLTKKEEANAKHLVKCWNSHYALLAACENTCKECQLEVGGPKPFISCKLCYVGTAIAQAKETENEST